MVINFRACGISRGARKLTRKPTLKKIVDLTVNIVKLLLKGNLKLFKHQIKI
jgi:hypothetical protein